MPDLSHWRIFLKVLPLSFLFCGLKVGVHWLGWEIWIFDALTGALFAATTFVLALVLNGTLNDYRVSEGIPTQIANAIEAIQDMSLMIAIGYPDYDPKPLREKLIQVAQTIHGWLEENQDLASVRQTLHSLNPSFTPLMKLGGGAVANRINTEQAKIRLLVAQIQGYRDTDFLGAAYVLLWLFLVGSVLALLLIQSDRFSETLTVSTFVFTSFVYLLVLIRDLDNPFQYDGRSSVDVDLSPLKNLHQDLPG